MPDPKEDWKMLLTEEERKDYQLGTLSTTGALRTVAALRALVEEKDKALRALNGYCQRFGFSNDYTNAAKAALALTESSMRKRLG